MRSVRSTLALGAFFVLPLVIAACGSSGGGNNVAVVAGNPISLQAFNHWMFVAAKSQAAQAPGQPVIVPNDPPNFDKCIANVRAQIPQLAKQPAKTLRNDCKQLFTSLSGQVLDFLIKTYWYQAEATKQHIKVTDAQVQKVFTTQKKQQFPSDTQFQAFLTQTGQTLQDILYRFRVNQIYTKLLAKYTTKVNQKQIQAYYNSHLTQFGTPETRNIRIVLTPTLAKAKAAMTALTHGQSWNVVAKKYSTDATTKNTGGLLVGVAKGQEDTALDTAAFAAPLNKLLGPLKGQFGYYVFEVTKINPKTQQTLAQATPLITQTLNGQVQTNAATAVDNQSKKDYQSKTTCKSAYQMADCSGFKAPKTSTTR
jgi:parvulin-like peptidyl-prolyl isomerase